MKATALHRSRSGFTLLELVLVLAVLVVLAAVVIPSFEGLYAEMRLTQAADQVRARLAEARGRAMSEGRPYCFAILPDHGNLRLAPDSPAYWSGSAPPALPPDAMDLPLVVDEALPDGIRFHFGEGPPTIDTRQAGASSQPVGSVSPDGWLPLATFLPDGTAREDVWFMVHGPHAQPILLRLRGLTGTVSTETP